jgi:hypothetical protein
MRIVMQWCCNQSGKASTIAAIVQLKTLGSNPGCVWSGSLAPCVKRIAVTAKEIRQRESQRINSIESLSCARAQEKPAQVLARANETGFLAFAS